MIMNSQAVVLATAMVVSTTFLFLAFGKQKPAFSSSSEIQDHSLDSSGQPLRSCLYSEEKKRQRKKKRVHFADNVKEKSGNGKEYRKEQSKKIISKVDQNCRYEIPRTPANRVALYNGILRDRIH
ncbi:uncharacterized protein LOC123218526 [Mangifera indica]|uniref:uncharacterized protein LOC123218526 n=1 Tax=Mangifera indica TaxID=29780 RepID=UPI001CF9A415|nr:uncharacterized protein LOC123218526 [Mangifera indica]